MGSPSKKQIEANRRNALNSTGPRTAGGKDRSRRNAMKHGFAAEVLVPEEGKDRFEQAMARWEHDSGPDNVVEQHLVRQAAVASVTLQRIDEARESNREDTAREAARRWAKKHQARARRLAKDLDRDPGNTVLDLESTAYGCEWLIRRWKALDDPMQLGRSWDQHALASAQLLLGVPEGTPSQDGDRVIRALWILAAAARPDKVAAIPRLPAELDLPTEPEPARNALRRFIAEQIARLETLRDQSWDEVEAPERSAVVRRCLAADDSPEAQLSHRYHRDADRSCNAAIRLFLNLRDRRRREMLTIAKEAGRLDIPRVPVGDGWWREVDSAPAPPGFARLDPIPTPDSPDNAPLAAPEPGADATPDSPPATTGDGRRNEPISTTDRPEQNPRNPRSKNDLRNATSEDTSGPDTGDTSQSGPSPSAPIADPTPRLDPDPRSIGPDRGPVERSNLPGSTPRAVAPPDRRP